MVAGNLKIGLGLLVFIIMSISIPVRAESEVAKLVREKLQGLSYSGSHDARHEKTTLFVHDCWGNTFSYSGNINKVNVTDKDPKTVSVHVWYSGSYERKIYVSPGCAHTNTERLNPSGELIFDVKLGLFKINIGAMESRNLSPVGGMDHDSNGFSVNGRDGVKDVIVRALNSLE